MTTSSSGRACLSPERDSFQARSPGLLAVGNAASVGTLIFQGVEDTAPPIDRVIYGELRQRRT